MKRSEFFFTAVLVPLDFLAIIAAAVSAYYLRLHPFFTEIRPVIFDLTIRGYMQVAIPVALLWIALFALSGLYSTRRKSIAAELTRVALACSTSMAAVFAILFFSRHLFQSRFIAVATWVLAIVYVSVTRLVVRGIQRSLLKYGIGDRHVVLIGESNTRKALQETFETHPSYGLNIVATFDTFNDSVAERITDMNDKYDIDEVVLADPEADRETVLDLLQFTDTEHMGLKYSADLFAAAVGRSVIHMFSGIPVIEVRKTPLEGWGAVFKRIFDIIGSLLLIIITLPIQIIVALALFIEQPGRVLFSRLPDGSKTKRVGQGGEQFHYFKFRSMIKDAHKYRDDEEFLEKHTDMREDSPLFKIERDPRVTAVGRFIRRYSLDELPEFYLVLMGRMSLVGPRPHLPEEVADYKPEQRKVLMVKPGITGLAQISGRADLDFEEEVRLDTYYIEHWSPWMDLYILLKTPFVVLFGKGAY
jgi:exopolysaccharide biosynthesis polyprenyl glycosylphosphotransferase